MPRGKRGKSGGGSEYSTPHELAKRFGCHVGTIKKHAGKNGVPALYEMPGGLRGRNSEWDAYEASLKPKTTETENAA